MLLWGSGNGVQVKERYRALSLRWHPDRNGGATNEEFQILSAAYQSILQEY